MEKKSSSEEIQNLFESLPFNAQQEALNFIENLSKRYHLEKQARLSPLREEGFVGLWKDRDDLENSTVWVRESRKREWEIS